MMNSYGKIWLIGLVFVLAILVIQMILVIQPAHAAGPWYVGPGGSDSDTCLGSLTRCASINGALAKPSFEAGDTIYVAGGTYTGSGDEVVLLNQSATLSGGWDVNFTTQSGISIIDGEGVRRGVTILSPGVSFPTVTVERFVIQNGSSAQGGGIYSSESSLTLNNSTVNGNTGGGIYGWIGSNLILNNSTVSHNTAPSGGGGGIASVQFLRLNNSTVSSNTASSGGGIQLGGMGRATLNNSTVSHNTSLFDGGGIRNVSVSDSTAFTLRNTIVAANIDNPGSGGYSPDCEGVINSAGYNLIGNTSGCTFTPTTGDLTDINPKLGPLEGSPGYHPLLSGSPAINAGNPAGCTDDLGNPLSTDQRGAPRVGLCDIGAVEMQELETSDKTAQVSTTLPGAPLSYTITLRNIDVTNMDNVVVTDTLPIPLTYISNSLTATGGSFGHNDGVITWAGLVDANSVVTITFGVTVSETIPLGASITNSAVISGGGEIFTRTATVNISGLIYLPIVLKNW